MHIQDDNLCGNEWHNNPQTFQKLMFQGQGCNGIAFYSRQVSGRYLEISVGILNHTEFAVYRLNTSVGISNWLFQRYFDPTNTTAGR